MADLDLTAAIEAATRALVEDKLGYLAPSVSDEFRAECRAAADAAVRAAAPHIARQVRGGVIAEFRAAKPPADWPLPGSPEWVAAWLDDDDRTAEHTGDPDA